MAEAHDAPDPPRNASPGAGLNPRSHEKYTDPKEDADAIIVFVDYLLRVVNRSSAQITLDTYLLKVLDTSFVKGTNYANLLVSEIPTKRRMEVMLAVLQRKEQGDGPALHCYIQALLAVLEQNEQAEVLQILSDQLQLSDEFGPIRAIIEILEPSDWPKLQLAARMRIENKLIQSIAEGAYNRATRKCSPDALGTWSTGLFTKFTLKTEAASAIIGRLFSDSVPAQDYELRRLQIALIVGETNWVSEETVN